VADTANIIENLAMDKAKTMNKQLTKEEKEIGLAISRFDMPALLQSLYDYEGETYDLDRYNQFLSEAKIKERAAKLT